MSVKGKCVIIKQLFSLKKLHVYNWTKHYGIFKWYLYLNWYTDYVLLSIYFFIVDGT